MKVKRLCDYGCGREAKHYFPSAKKWCCENKHQYCPVNKLKYSHKAWNKSLTKDSDKRVAKYVKNMKETKQRMVFIAWNKGLTKNTDKRVAGYAKNMKIAKKGKPNYKLRKDISVNGITPGKLRALFKKSLYIEWIYPILKRDGFLCRKCGNSIELEVHHIKPYFKLFNKAMNTVGLNIENYLKWSRDDIKKLEKQINKLHMLGLGITLCKNCHGEEDENRRRFFKKK